MTSLKELRDGLEARLKTIPGLRVHRTMPETLLPPAAVFKPMSGQYGVTFDSGSHDKQFQILVLASKASSRTAQDQLDSFIDEEGPNSVYAAIEADDTLGGVADWTRVADWDDYEEYIVSSESYLGVTFTLEVCTSGS